MHKYLILLAFLICSSSYALTVENTDFPASKTNVIDGRVISATLEAPISLKLGHNHLQNIPAGTRFSFFENSGSKDNLKVSGIILTQKMKDQIWTLPNKEQIFINCGSTHIASFIRLGEDSELLEGCYSAKEQTVKTPLGEATLNKRSVLAFFKDGNLKGSTKTSGRVSVDGNTILIAPNTSLRFHDNKNIYFFTPDTEEHFVLKTELSENTSFYQPNIGKLLPVVFYENGKISTAILSAVVKYLVPIKAFGVYLNLKAGTGPIGFDENGNVDRMVLEPGVRIRVQTETFVRSTERTTGVVSFGRFTSGMQVKLPRFTQLFLNKNKELQGYPEQGPKGLVFFNELSDTPF